MAVQKSGGQAVDVLELAEPGDEAPIGNQIAVLGRTQNVESNRDRGAQSDRALLSADVVLLEDAQRRDPRMAIRGIGDRVRPARTRNRPTGDRAEFPTEDLRLARPEFANQSNTQLATEIAIEGLLDGEGVFPEGL